jgi:hypothetical protein
MRTIVALWMCAGGGALGAAGCVGSIEGAGSPAEGAGGGEAAAAGPASPGLPAATPAAAGTRPESGAGAPPHVEAACRPGPRAPVGTPRLWRLSGLQLENTLAALFGGAGSAEARAALAGIRVPFDGSGRGARVSPLAADHNVDADGLETALAAAEQISPRLAVKLGRAAADCLPASGPAKSACLASIARDLGPRLFRRPLAPPEVDHYVAVALAGEARLGREGGLLAMLEALVASPFTLFRTELGAGPPDADGRIGLEPFEIASALSYGLADGPPDPELWAAAATGALSSPVAVRAHALRLIGPAARLGAVSRFFADLFQFGAVGSASKDPKRYPFFNPDGLHDDTSRLVASVIASRARTGPLEALLTTTSGIARARTAAHYGLPTGAVGAAPGPVEFPARQRVGLLAQPSWLVGYSTPDENEPIKRGVYVRKELLCASLPDIDIGAVPPLPDLPAATARERLEVHRQTPACAACHRLFDPLGLAFETFDHTGRPRTTEHGKPVDPAGELLGAGDEDGRFADHAELMERLARSSAVKDCFVTQSFQHFMGRPPEAGDACTLARVRQSYVRGGGDYVEMLATLFSSESLLRRRAP